MGVINLEEENKIPEIEKGSSNKLGKMGTFLSLYPSFHFSSNDNNEIILNEWFYLFSFIEIWLSISAFTYFNFVPPASALNFEQPEKFDCL